MPEGKKIKDKMVEKNKNLTVPNLISVIRIIIIPFFAYFYLRDYLIIAALLLVLSGLSDMFDGLIARKFDQVTDLGKLLDPLADKLTQGVVAICLAVTIPQLRVILAVFIVKECVMLAGGIFLLKRKKRPAAAQWYGKVSTVLFYFSVTVIVVMHTFLNVEARLFDIVSVVLLTVTAMFMLYSLIRYILLFREIMSSKDPQYDFDLPEEIRGKDKDSEKESRKESDKES